MTDTPGPKQNNRKSIETSVFIKEVADRLFLPEDTIQAVWNVSAAVITEALLREEQVIIRRFGVFRLKKGSARFKASAALRQILRESAMEKYGVEIDNEAALMAKVTGECPKCKAALVSKSPPSCQTCGTAPFEKKVQNLKGAQLAKNKHYTAMVDGFNILYGKPDEEE